MDMKTMQVDKLRVEIYENRTLMGEAAARDIKAKIAELLSQKAEINMIFCSGSFSKRRFEGAC